MIASSTFSLAQQTSQVLQNTLPADAQTTEQSRAASPLISQVAINEFALRFSSAMIEMLANEGVSPTSPLSKRLKAYAAAGVAPVGAASRFA